MRKTFLNKTGVLFISIAAILMLNSFSQTGQKIYIKMKSENLHNGIKNKVEAELFYNIGKGEVITHFMYPTEFVRLTNNVGEAKIYVPKDNTIIIQQDKAMSSENDIIYFFLFNKIMDLGLNDLGYKMVKSYKDDGVFITEWEPVVYENERVKKVVLAHENNLPIFTSYFNQKNKPVRKVYYSDYVPVSNGAIPSTIVDITYFEKGDSIINRKQYYGIESGHQLSGSYFDFQIPSNAKRMNSLK